MARGDIIGLLNTDDEYENNIFAAVMAFFMTIQKSMRYPGAQPFPFTQWLQKEIILRLGPVTADNLLVRATIGIPAINGFFFRKAVFDRIGFFNLEYRFAADRELLFRFFSRRLRSSASSTAMYINTVPTRVP